MNSETETYKNRDKFLLICLSIQRVILTCDSQQDKDMMTDRQTDRQEGTVAAGGQQQAAAWRGGGSVAAQPGD